MRGDDGERLAEVHLEGLGYVLVARNHRAIGPGGKQVGEVDLVMQHETDLVFVEVRTRSDTTRGTAAETIDARKRSRIVAAARDYLTAHLWAGPLRFDVVGITGVGEDQILEHIVDAFSVDR